MIVGIKKAAELIGLSEWELRTGAKKGKYPFYRPGSGKANAPYMFDVDLLVEAIKKECIKNAEEQKELIEQEEMYSFKNMKIIK